MTFHLKILTVFLQKNDFLSKFFSSKFGLFSYFFFTFYRKILAQNLT